MRRLTPYVTALMLTAVSVGCGNPVPEVHTVGTPIVIATSSTTLATTTTEVATTTEPPTTVETTTSTSSTLPPATPVPTPPPTTRPVPVATVAPTTTWLEPEPTPDVADPPVGGVPANAFLACVRQRESGGSYTIVNPSSGAGGAYQFMPSTWQGGGWAARYGVARAEWAAPWQQDQAALELYQRSGAAPWGGHCP